MDESLKHHNPNPYATANPLSKLLFWWMNPLFKRGYVRQLEVEDMYNVCHEDQSELLGTRLEKEWRKELDKAKGGHGKPSLVKALIRMFGLEYMMFGIILFLEEATKVVQPLLLGGLIRYFTPNTTVTRTDAYMYAMGVSLCGIMLAVSHHPYFFGVQRLGMKMRIACCSLLYRKSLRLSNAGLGQTTTGQIVNLMSNDVNRFDQAVIFLHFLWIGPLEAVAVLAILWRELGPSTLAGFAVLLLLVPIQGWMGKLFSKFRQKTAKHTDERVRLMNEIIAGMRVIKMYCWEKPFGDLVEKVRSAELKKFRQLAKLRGVIEGMVGDKLLHLAVFTSYALSGGLFRTDVIFVAANLYRAIQLGTTYFMPTAMQHVADLMVTFVRVELILPGGNLKLFSAECSKVRNLQYTRGLIVGPFFVSVKLFVLVLFLPYSLSGHALFAETVFKTVALFQAIRLGCVLFMPFAIAFASEAMVTIKRLQVSKYGSSRSKLIVC